MQELDDADFVAALTRGDASFTLSALRARVEQIYARLNDAWNKRDIEPLRPLCLPAMLDSLAFTLADYERAGRRGQLVDGKIDALELAKLRQSDAYDAVTVRMIAHAHGCDFTTDASGAVVSGSKDQRVLYSEYWTVARANRAARRLDVGEDRD